MVNNLLKRDAIKYFTKSILPSVIKHYGANNKFEMREAWKNYIHTLYVGGYITGYQYSTWTIPMTIRGKSGRK